MPFVWWNHHIATPLYHCCQVTGWLLPELRTTGFVVLDELNLTMPLDFMASDAMWSYSTRKSEISCRVIGKRRCLYRRIRHDPYMFLDIRRCNFASEIQWTNFHHPMTMPCGVIAFAIPAWELSLGTWFLFRKEQACGCATWLYLAQDGWVGFALGKTSLELGEEE